MEPRHILYIIDQLDSLEGGAERSLWLTTRLLPPERYRATVVTLKKPDDPICVGKFPCPVRVLTLDRTYGIRALHCAMHLRSLIRSERVEITQTFFESSDLWGGLVAKLSGCPVLISSRRDMGFRRLRKHRAAYRLLGPIFDRIHTVSNAVRDYTIRQDGADPIKVVTIPNGVDMQAIQLTADSACIRSQYGLEKASHVVVDITTVRQVKGIDTLIRAAVKVRHQFPRVLFVLAGKISEPAYFAEINSLLSELELAENFRFLGGVEPVFPLLNICSVFCHLSRNDGLSNAMLEAMACGLPCVVTRVGGNPEIIEEGRNGFVVPPDAPELAADRIIALLRYPDCARRIGERARQIVYENFTAEVMVRRFVELYDGLTHEADHRSVN
jgi:glycosyltransferase involved in cell wall biosynthesis